MATWRTVLAPQKALEDPLLHLPCSNIVEFKKGQMIYSQDQPSRTVSQALSIWGASDRVLPFGATLKFDERSARNKEILNPDCLHK